MKVISQSDSDENEMLNECFLVELGSSCPGLSFLYVLAVKRVCC